MSRAVPAARAACVGAVAAVLLGGCRGEGVTPPEIRVPATASITVTLFAPNRGDGAVRATVSAFVTPGRDDAGAVRAITTPPQVGGRPVPLRAGTGDPWGTIGGEGVVTFAAAELRAPLVVDAPVIAGLTASAPRVALSVLRPLDPDTVRLRADGSLRLALDVAAGGGTPAHRFWGLTVDGAGAVSLRGDSIPPAAIVVPASLLPPPAPDGLWRVRLDWNEQHAPRDGRPPVGPYDVRAGVQQHVAWVVRR